MLLVTGASGFVGRTLLDELTRANVPVRAAVRDGAAAARIRDDKVDVVRVGAIDGHTNWSAALAGVDTVIHLAGRVPTGSGSDSRVLSVHRNVNELATLRLATEAVARGVRRFVFASTIKVHGESTGMQPIRADDAPAPVGPYAYTKLEAEKGLQRIGRESSLEVVIVRPPLVYGPGVKASFLHLLRLVHSGVPLPFGGLCNQRSLVAVWTLCSLLQAAATKPAAAGQVLLVSDGQDWSTPELIQALAAAMGRRARLLRIPRAAWPYLCRLSGGKLGPLCDSLRVDMNPTCATLGWAPPRSREEGILRTVEWFLRQHPTSSTQRP